LLKQWIGRAAHRVAQNSTLKTINTERAQMRNSQSVAKPYRHNAATWMTERTFRAGDIDGSHQCRMLDGLSL